MAFVSIVPAPVRVRCDGHGRPREIRVGGERLPVTAIEVVRDETAAYPADRGPRTSFVVRTGTWRLRLVCHHRDGRWLVEALDPRPTALAAAA
jgi:hypothetical protein